MAEADSQEETMVELRRRWERYRQARSVATPFAPPGFTNGGSPASVERIPSARRPRKTGGIREATERIRSNVGAPDTRTGDPFGGLYRAGDATSTKEDRKKKWSNAVR